MRDVDGGRAQAALELANLGPRGDAELGVEVAERLIEEKRHRVAHDGPADRHALALAAGELAGLAV